MKSLFFAELIHSLHIAVFFYVILGFFLLPCKYLTKYILFIIFVLLDWNDWDGMCILTKIEYYFRTGDWSVKSPIEGGPEFFRPLINEYFNLSLTPIQADRLNNFIFILCLLIGFLRLRFRCFTCK